MMLRSFGMSSLWIRLISLTWILGSVYGSGDSADYNDDGFFQFNDEKDNWDDYSMSALRCIQQQNEDYIVFNMYDKNNGDCHKRNKVGTYKASLSNFVKAYTRQADINARAKGYGYDLDEDILQLLDCSYYENDNGFQGYVKLSCNPTTGRSFLVRSYTDEYCSQKDSTQYNHNFDISALRVKYDVCQSCPVEKNNYYENNYYENNNNRMLEEENNYYNFNSHKDDSPLCSAAWYYKSTCNRNCVKMAMSGTQKKRGFTAFQRFCASVLVILALVLSFAVYGQRKRMDTQDSVLEDAALAKAGIKKTWIPRILIGIIVVILFFMVIGVPGITFFLLLTANACLFLYWSHLKYRKDGQVDVAGHIIYGKNKNNNVVTEGYHESSEQLS